MEEGGVESQTVGLVGRKKPMKAGSKTRSGWAEETQPDLDPMHLNEAVGNRER